MIYPIADLWSLMAPHLGFGGPVRPANIGFGMGNAEDSCYYWEDDHRAVVGFPGTQGDFPDWWTNFDVLPNKDGLHRGFARACEEYISVDFRDLLRGAHAAGKRLEFCGMSQGGGYACTLACLLHWHKPHIEVSEIVHFGGPPWCLSRVAADLDSWCPVTRVVTPHDPVPCSWLPLRREGHRIEVPGCAGAEIAGVLDHRPEVYTAGIRAHCLACGDLAGVTAMNALMGEAPV